MKRNNAYLSLLIILLQFSPRTYSQYNILELQNGDIIKKTSISQIEPHGDGMNVYWDFSNIKKFESHEVCYIFSDSIITKIDDSISHYITKGDTVFLISEENPLESIFYESGIPYPSIHFEYGDSIDAIICGHGKYSDICLTSLSGTTKIKADGYGTVLLPNSQIITDVLRIHRITTISKRMANNDSIIKAIPHLEIEDSYMWITDVEHCPVCEITTRSCYNGADPISTEHAYYLYDHASESIPIDSQEDIIVTDHSNTPYINYSLQITNGNIIVTYDLRCDANLIFLVSDVTGILHKQLSFKQEKGNGLQILIDCHGLKHGNYVL